MRLIYFGCLGLFLIAACGDKANRPAEFKSQSKGMEFKVANPGVGDPVQRGNWLRMQVAQYFNDSLLSDTHDRWPFYQRYDSSEMTPESLRIFKNVREGDSLEFRVRADSAFGKNPPPFAKKGGYLLTRVKVEKIIRTEDDYRYDTAAQAGALRKKYEERSNY